MQINFDSIFSNFGNQENCQITVQLGNTTVQNSTLPLINDK
jgi:hypothetical protein